MLQNHANSIYLTCTSLYENVQGNSGTDKIHWSCRRQDKSQAPAPSPQTPSWSEKEPQQIVVGFSVTFRQQLFQMNFRLYLEEHLSRKHMLSTVVNYLHALIGELQDLGLSSFFFFSSATQQWNPRFISSVLSWERCFQETIPQTQMHFPSALHSPLCNFFPTSFLTKIPHSSCFHHLNYYLRSQEIYSLQTSSCMKTKHKGNLQAWPSCWSHLLQNSEAPKSIPGLRPWEKRWYREEKKFVFLLMPRFSLFNYHTLQWL